MAWTALADNYPLTYIYDFVRENACEGSEDDSARIVAKLQEAIDQALTTVEADCVEHGEDLQRAHVCRALLSMSLAYVMDLDSDMTEYEWQKEAQEALDRKRKRKRKVPTPTGSVQ